MTCIVNLFAACHIFLRLIDEIPATYTKRDKFDHHMAKYVHVTFSSINIYLAKPYTQTNKADVAVHCL